MSRQPGEVHLLDPLGRRGAQEGLVAVADPMAQRYGELVKVLFLVGFWSAATSSILGGWNAAAKYFRGFLVWCTFPPMLLFSLDEPVLLVIIYAALGALFLPFIAVVEIRDLF